MLDAHQKSAVETYDKRALVIAGPGSGKTRVLVARMAHMIKQQKVTPSHVVAITFTRHAAQEIRARMPADVAPGFIGTLHAFCLQLLMKYGQALGIEAEWLTILSDEEAMLEEREALAGAGLIKPKAGGRWNWTGCKAGEWKQYREQIMAGMIEPESEPTLLPAWQTYMARLAAQNTLTFGMLCYLAYDLLGLSEIARKVRRRHQHILVDEFQDTDHMQWKIVNRIIQRLAPATLFVVGDSDQSIYQWRHADPGIMLDMVSDKKTTVHHLVNCYRYGHEIGEASQALVKRNVQRIPTSLEFKGAEGTAGYYLHWNMDQVVSLVKLVARQLDLKHQDVAILARTHAILDKAKRALDANGIPSNKLGRLNDLRKAPEFRACVGLLRLGVNPGDRQAFMAAATSLGLTDKEVWGIREVCHAQRCTLWKAYCMLWGDTELPVSMFDLANMLNDRVKFIDDYRPALDYLQRLWVCHGFQDIQAMVNYLAMAATQDEVALGGDAVTLATVHAAKGLEWPLVIMLGMNQNLFPMGRALLEDRLEEERRLAYVAMTRAKQAVFMVHLSQTDDLHKAGWQPARKQVEPSQFIAEAQLAKGGAKLV